MLWSDYFYYDETSPSCLRWKHARRSGKSYKRIHQEANSCAGSINGEGYWQVRLDNRNHQVHRIVFEMVSGKQIGENQQIDHLDRCRSNNLFENLKLVTKTANLHNKCMYSNNTTGVTGVRLVKKTVNGREYVSWLAIWREGGRHKEKWISCNKHGYDLAFQLACEHREKMIAQLNEQGAGYSPTHGK